MFDSLLVMSPSKPKSFLTHREAPSLSLVTSQGLSGNTTVTLPIETTLIDGITKLYSIDVIIRGTVYDDSLKFICIAASVYVNTFLLE